MQMSQKSAHCAGISFGFDKSFRNDLVQLWMWSSLSEHWHQLTSPRWNSSNRGTPSILEGSLHCQKDLGVLPLDPRRISAGTLGVSWNGEERGFSSQLWFTSQLCYSLICLLQRKKLRHTEIKEPVGVYMFNPYMFNPIRLNRFCQCLEH